MRPLERSQLIDALIEGDISEADFLRLEAEFSVDPTARKEYFDRLALSLLLESEAAASADSKVVPLPTAARRWFPSYTAIAAVLVGLLVVAGMVWKKPADKSVAPQALLSHEEQKASGFAVFVGQAGTVWKGSIPMSAGALVPSGPLHLSTGIAQMELFSGVTVIVEGEADFEIISPMEMAVTRGKIRARVPEPAQGFRIRTAAGDLVDLGTEFAMDVSGTHSEVHVLDGEVEWHPQTEPMRRMAKGEALRWEANGTGTPLTANAAEFIGVTELGEKLASSRESRRADWLRFSEKLRQDPRLVAYYQMGAAESWSRRLPNKAVAGEKTVREGAIVAATRSDDRWGTSGGALDFSPTGSRVRLSVPGEYRSLTLNCWVKINSLDRWYNSLFLTDGHELHEPHWQIMDDGRLFFSVKKRDVFDRKKGELDKHIFYSPPFWNAALSGQWIMISTVYDVDARLVTHYLNGKQLSQEPVPAEYLVENVNIGAASICNWGMPMREDPHFAVRNLNGSMDEFALFAGALTAPEIAEIYSHGKP